MYVLFRGNDFRKKIGHPQEWRALQDNQNVRTNISSVSLLWQVDCDLGCDDLPEPDFSWKFWPMLLFVAQIHKQDNFHTSSLCDLYGTMTHLLKGTHVVLAVDSSSGLEEHMQGVFRDFFVMSMTVLILGRLVLAINRNIRVRTSLFLKPCSSQETTIPFEFVVVFNVDLWQCLNHAGQGCSWSLTCLMCTQPNIKVCFLVVLRSPVVDEPSDCGAQ